MIADRPDSAYDICTKYAPNCLDQVSQLTDGGTSGSTRTFSSSSVQRERSSSARNGASSDQGTLTNNFSGSRGNLNLNEQSGSESRSSARNIGLSSVGLSSASSISLNTESTLMSQDISGESDGLGAGFNGEDDYYDSLNSGDENESTNSRPNRTRTAPPIEPVYNPEPRQNENEIGENVGGESSENENAPVTTNTSVFTTIVNGVKMKSLPGPRGNLTIDFNENVEPSMSVNRHARPEGR